MSQYLPGIETIALSLEDAMIGARAGVDRLELCSAIELGGLTPSLGFVNQIVKNCPLPARVMVRCRAGSFCYNDFEKEVMLEDCRTMIDLGVDGLVVGASDADGRLDVDYLEKVMRLATGVRVTFHRVFDTLPNMFDALEVLIEMGVSSVLTGGGFKSALQGKENLKWLVGQADGRIEILVGGGVRASNLGELASETGASFFHAGPFVVAPQTDQERLERVGLGSPAFVADATAIQALVAVRNHLTIGLS